jgi:hypothetical protein
MARDIPTLIEDLHALTESDFDYNLVQMDGPERLDAICDDVAALPRPADVFPEFFRLMERLAQSDLGSPGPLVHTMEKHIGLYEDFLEDSVKRKPTILSLWMVNRIANASRDDRGRWIALLRATTTHAEASEEAREQATGFLQHQNEI